MGIRATGIGRCCARLFCAASCDGDCFGIGDACGLGREERLGLELTRKSEATLEDQIHRLDDVQLLFDKHLLLLCAFLGFHNRFLSYFSCLSPLGTYSALSR
jgi:hypothetical protein